jgi:hypothetical protein
MTCLSFVKRLSKHLLAKLEKERVSTHPRIDHRLAKNNNFNGITIIFVYYAMINCLWRMRMFNPSDLSAFADADLDALVSGPGRPIDGTIFL